MHFSTLFSAAALSQLALARYVIQDDYMSGAFYDNFEFFTAPDPTRGMPIHPRLVGGSVTDDA